MKAERAERARVPAQTMQQKMQAAAAHARAHTLLQEQFADAITMSVKSLTGETTLVKVRQCRVFVKLTCVSNYT